MLIYNDNFSVLKEQDINYFRKVIAEQAGTYPEGVTADEIYEYWCSTIDFELDDLLQELKRIDTNYIYAIANLGLWNGRVSGYTRLNNLEDILSCGEDYNTLETDRYNLTLTAIHHDGTNYITFRELKPDLTDEQVYNLEDKLYNGTWTRKDLSRYTTSLKQKVECIYQ